MKDWKRNLALLVQGHFVSRCGTLLFDILIVLWMKENCPYVSLMGLILIASHLPGILLAPLGGVLADRWNKKRILVLSDFICGATLVLWGLALLIQGGIGFTIAAFFISAVLLSVLGALFNPAVSSMIPLMIPRERLQRANSLYGLSTNLGGLLGQGLSAVLLKLFALPWLFLLNGASFIVSALSETLLRVQHKKECSKSINDMSLRAMFRQGYRYVMNNRPLLSLVLIIALFHLFMAVIPLLVPYYCIDLLSKDSSWVGLILILLSIGVSSGFFLSRILSFNGSNIKTLLLTFLGAAAFVFSLMGIVQHIVALGAGLFIIGVLVGILVVNYQTVIQRSTPEELQGRVFGFLSTIINLTFPLGYGIYGILMDILSRNLRVNQAIPFILWGMSIILGLSTLFFLRVQFKDLFQISTSEEIQR